jgi:hypothetical protein
VLVFRSFDLFLPKNEEEESGMRLSISSGPRLLDDESQSAF